ncbi:MAG: MATE family efflux transporter [Lachnospiraceae bacterium]|nr:MATE family efflux transporter [Lachnospiraceae bacterium]
MVLAVAIPIIVQNGISNFVNMLDNIMVGQVGTEQMSGVSIVNQLMFVFNLALFGAVSGPGIFTAQYVGQKNNEGVRYTIRFKLIMSVVLSVLGVSIFMLFKDNLIMMFLHDNNEGLDLTRTLGYAKEYLMAMLFGLFPFAITCSYASTLRESGETNVPMVAGLIAVGVNLVFNYILIFGHFGAPKLGVVGAAVATVISRFVELFIVVFWTHKHKERAAFAVGLYKGFHIPGQLSKKIIITGFPLFINEFFWSLGMSMVTQCYSMRGLEVIAAFNISNTIVNLFNVVLISMGSVVAIIIGQQLGSGDTEAVVDTDRKLITLGVLSSALLGIILIIMAPLFPRFYNTTDSIRNLSVELMRVAAIFMPVGSYLNCAYFTIRSGGKTFITFLFDSAYLWVICWPIAFVLSRYTGMTIIPMYITILSLDFIKVVIGAILLKKRIWIKSLVA